MITFSVINKKLPRVETPGRSSENQQTELFDIIVYKQFPSLASMVRTQPQEMFTSLKVQHPPRGSRLPVDGQQKD